MSKVLIEVPDEFIDWAGWAQHNLDKGLGGLKDGSTQLADRRVQDDPGPSAPSEPADPWGAPQSGATTAAPRSGASTNVPPATTSEPAGLPATPPKEYANFTVEGKTHTFNLQGAPPCSHGQPAVRVTGVKESTGKQWKQFRCALSSTDRWKDKCEFQQWA